MVILKFIIRHKLMAIISLAVLAAGGYYAYQKSAVQPIQTRYALGTVERGVLAITVSGTGQVAVSDQVEVKPKVSGDLVFVSAVKDQAVREGDVLARLDSHDAQAEVSDAEIALESAEVALEDMTAPPDAQDLLQARNALSQAERDLEKAKDTYETIEADTEQTLADAYENGYSQVSSAFYNLSDCMKDLRDVLGTNAAEDENINAYKLILGSNSAYIQRLLDDYDAAKESYDTSFASFRNVFSDSERDVIYDLINDTLDTSETVLRALESARHMYDAIQVTSYSQYRIASTVNTMSPKVESDISSLTSTINTLQQTLDEIDTTVADTPGDIKDAELSLRAAEEKVEEKKQALDDIEEGSDSLDIRTQENVVAQREAALRDAREKLSDTAIRAPFDGVIASVDAKKGDSVTSGTVIVTLITEQKLAEITLNEIDVAKVRVGQKATVVVDAVSELSITGEVAEVDSIGAVSQGVVTYGVKIMFDVQDDRVKPGMSLSATIITDAGMDVLMVPSSAVKGFDGDNYVEMLDDAVPAAANGTSSASASFTSVSGPRQQAVEIGRSNDTMTEIVSGLNEGDTVVTSTIKPSSSSSSSTSSAGGSIFGGLPGTGPARGSTGAGGGNVMFHRD